MTIKKSELEQILSYVAHADKMMAIAKVQKSQVMANDALQCAQEALYDLRNYLDFSINDIENDDEDTTIDDINAARAAFEANDGEGF